ncbi:response regulator transcription factor [Nostoc sp. NIES-2111]
MNSDEAKVSEAIVTILIADDHALFRSGVEAVLHKEQNMRVVAEAGDGATAIEAILRLRPDVSLVDLQMPEVEGPEVVRQVRAIWPEARILILTTYDFDEDIERALRNGARGYLLKDTLGPELARCIREVHAGRTCIAPAVAGKLVQRMTQVHLTMREAQVLRLVADGNANKEIASQLDISEATVKLHLSNLFQKLGAQSRTEAVKIGVRRGLIRLPS